jgi:hypothetical protein
MKAPLGPIGIDSDVKSGAISESVPDVIAVEVSLTLTRWVGLPVNVSRAFWPEAVVVTVTGGPPAVIGAVTSAGVGVSRTVTEPPPDDGSRRTV